MKKQQGGFTLIELIMVIVILGILAAFALPRFANFSSDARAATVQGLAGSMKSASAIVHSAWLARGSSGTEVKLENGVTVVTTTAGYPVAGSTGIEQALEMDGFVPVTDEAGAYAPEGYSGSDCKVTYTVGTPPEIDVTDACGNAASASEEEEEEEEESAGDGGA